VTERLYYTDCYQTAFDAEAVSLSDDGLRVTLNRTAFYPTSGGQLFDLGTLAAARIVEVIDEGDEIVHVLDKPIPPGPVHGEIDWPRRFAFMQQHTGQHLLSAVFHELYGFATASVHLGVEGGTIELATGTVTDQQLRAAERRANEVITENREVTIAFEENPEGLRKASEREGALRVVTIAGLDKSACGGTHVRRTGEIGVILIRRQEKIRGNVRLEFVAGSTAVRRARADYELLTAAAKAFSKPLEEVPAAVISLQESAKDSSKQAKALALELAAHKGRELYAAAPAAADGIRRYWHQLDVPVDETTRAIAQAFVACGGEAIFLATGAGTALLAATPGAGIHCGNFLKEHGRGGGTPTLAQGTLKLGTGDAIPNLLAIRSTPNPS